MSWVVQPMQMTSLCDSLEWDQKVPHEHLILSQFVLCKSNTVVSLFNVFDQIKSNCAHVLNNDIFVHLVRI